jgi:hypothetical protein
MSLTQLKSTFYERDVIYGRCKRYLIASMQLVVLPTIKALAKDTWGIS